MQQMAWVRHKGLASSAEDAAGTEVWCLIKYSIPDSREKAKLAAKARGIMEHLDLSAYSGFPPSSTKPSNEEAINFLERGLGLHPVETRPVDLECAGEIVVCLLLVFGL